MTAAGAPAFRLGPVLARHSGALVCALLLSVGLCVLDDYGISWDEEEHRQHMQKSFRAIISGTGTGLPKTEDKYYGFAFELPLLLVERFLGLEDSRSIYLTRHALAHFFFLLGGMGCYLLAYRLFGNRLLAVCALLLFVLHPRLYAHSFFNSKDVPFASMFMLALFLVQRAFRKETISAFLLCGVGVGVLTNLRIMGMLLILVVVAMRAGEWFVAARSRHHVLRTSGAFVGASVVTLYVLSPYLWANPLRFGDAFTTLTSHPNIQNEIFQGTIFSTDEFPLHYIPTWFTITTPPVVLLLGLCGLGQILYGALTRPGALMRQTSLRFGALLVVCFVGPILAVLLFRPHIHDGWRHMYFLHAPFCLLAIYGLHGVTAGCRRRWVRAGLYGLAGGGLGVVVVEMIQLHPYQQVYFNRLVDRTTPESLRAQYELAYWGVPYREGLEYLLKRYPSGPLAISSNHCLHVKQNRFILPSADRDRIEVCPFTYDFYLTDTSVPLRPGIYARQVYNNTILTVEKMMLTAEEATTDAYRAAHRVTVASPPIIRAAFDIYLHDDLLVYVAEPCAVAEGRVFLHLHPAHVEDLPPYRVQYGFDNHDFYWNGSGGGSGRCLRIVRLPQYQIAWLATGEYDERGALWRETFMFPERGEGRDAAVADTVAGIGKAGRP